MDAFDKDGSRQDILLIGEGLELDFVHHDAEFDGVSLNETGWEEKIKVRIVSESDELSLMLGKGNKNSFYKTIPSIIIA